MEKINWLFLFLFAFTMAACEKDVAPDTAAPVVTITSPAATSSFLVVDEVGLRARVTDNVGVEQVWVFITDPNGNRRELDKVDIDFVDNDRDENLKVKFFLAERSVAGTYRATVEAQDAQQNRSESTVSITVQAPDLQKGAFNTALFKNTAFRVWVIANRAALTEDEFGRSVFQIMDTDRNLYVEENEFDMFTTDFDLENEKSSNWYWSDEFDGLSLGTLNFLLRNVRFFDDWDLDNNDLLSGTELTGGIFNRWDDNKDGVLSRNEYEKKMHTYFIP